MKKHLRDILTLILIVTAGMEAAAQMEVTDATTPPFTATNLISNIFLGDGVSVLDIQYEGDDAAVGYFKDGESAIGLDRGIIMTSGRAAAQSCNAGPFGADCLGNSFANNPANSNANDADLNDIANGTPEDVAKYTITFQPFADTLRFRYVFASEEYPEFSCSPFNDVFGFFISGPGITGTSPSGSQNIALIPGTNTPVAIDKVHPQNGNNCPGLNDQFYNDNNGMQLQPVYDGFLDIFTAEAIVIPCETYTIKLMIADVGDPNYDSGVFLEAKSFGTGTIDVNAATISLDGTITEGCSNGSFTFSVQQEVEEDLLLDYTIIGQAENGVDYEFIPEDLFIPEGESSLTVNINGIVDDIDEGLEGIGIDIQRDICNRDTFWMYIRDNEIVPPALGPDLQSCQGDSVVLDGNLPLPLPEPPSFTNDQDYFVDETEPVYSPIQVVGVQPTTLGPGVIQSVCVNIDHNWVDDLDLYLISPGGFFIELSSMNGSNCDNYNNVCFTPTATTPINYVFPWPTCASGEEPGFSNGFFQPEGIWSDLWDGDNPTNGTWQLLVLDESPGFDGDILDWTITFEPLYQLFYEWAPTDGLNCADCPDPMASPDSTTTYILRAWDTYGCEVYDTITVNIELPLDEPVINCVSVTNNSIDFEWTDVPGATGYQVSINNGPFTDPNNGMFGHTVMGLNLDESVTIEVITQGPCGGLTGSTTCTTPDCDAPSLNITNINHVDCANDMNGVISVEASGGAGDYEFTLDGMSPMSGQGIFTGLDGGTYELTVIDGWGCPNTINVTVNEPDELIGIPEILNDASCFNSQDGSATIAVTGGTQPYIIDWSNSQQQDTATGLSPGSHFVFITDNNNCVFNTNFPISQPIELELIMTSNNISCMGGNSGSANVEIEGGTPPYSIQWDANAGNATTNTASNLSAGTYSVLVTDANGCAAMGNTTVSQPIGMMTDITSTDVQCAGTSDGTAIILTTGGNSPYTYLWSDGQTVPDPSGLDALQYFVTVTDLSGCTTVDSVVISSPPILELSLSANDALCFGEMSGDAQSNAVGGTPPYTYQWDNGDATDAIQNIGAGFYCLIVTDFNGCQINDCIEVAEPPTIEISAIPTNAACNSAEGMIELTINGGNAPFQYLWSDGQTTETATNLLPGDYTVTVTDMNDCSAVLSETIEESTAISIDTQIEGALCNGENTGNIQITPMGGTGIYSYAWTGPNGFTSTDQNISDVFGGLYQLNIEDSDGCTFSTELDIPQPDEPLELLYNVQNTSCPDTQDGIISIEGTGGTPPYEYQLDSNGFTGNPNFLPLPFGLYDVAISDGNGCQFEVTGILVDEPEPFSVEIGDDQIVDYNNIAFFHPTLINVPDSLQDTYSFEWTSSNPSLPVNHPNWLSTSIDALGQTALTLTVTSASGCVEEDMVNLFVSTNRRLEVPTGFTPGNDGPAQNNLLHVHGQSKMIENIALFQVFDRWGELLYEASDFEVNDLSVGWDGMFKGKEMPAGVYVWHLEVDFIDGATESYKGHTTLIR